MQNETPFQIALIIALVLFLAVRVHYRIKTKTLSKESFPQDTRVMLKILLLVLILTFLAMIVWLINSEWMIWASLSLPDWSRWVGAALALASTPLLYWTHLTLGRSYSAKLEIKEEHKFITTGPYHWVRHPMYSTIFFWTAGLSLITSSWITFFLPLAFALFAILRVPREEKMMIEKYGNEYRNYMKRTGRFLLRLSL